MCQCMCVCCVYGQCTILVGGAYNLNAMLRFCFVKTYIYINVHVHMYVCVCLCVCVGGCGCTGTILVGGAFNPKPMPPEVLFCQNFTSVHIEMVS